MKENDTILIAGGTGLIGRELTTLLRKKGARVRILTRGESKPEKGIFHWNPLACEVDPKALEDVTVIVNLSGAAIGDKRWTKKRKKELFDSRVGTTECLWKQAADLPSLRHFLTASGAVCYGFENDDKIYKETDPFGTDLLSQITEKWEAAADLFESKCTVTKVRTAVVLDRNEGPLPKMAAPIRWGVGSSLGSGKQAMPWIHLRDMARAYVFFIEEQLGGVYNVNAGNTDNATLTRVLAKVLKRPLWLPKVPAFVLKLLLGQMADELVLKGLKADNALLLSKGFVFQYEDLETAIREVYS